MKWVLSFPKAKPGSLRAEEERRQLLVYKSAAKFSCGSPPTHSERILFGEQTQTTWKAVGGEDERLPPRGRTSRTCPPDLSGRRWTLGSLHVGHVAVRWSKKSAKVPFP